MRARGRWLMRERSPEEEESGRRQQEGRKEKESNENRKDHQQGGRENALCIEKQQAKAKQQS